jgi:hypothetical protein
MADTPIKCCVIYTRKSSEEGLEQDYNSLHAQREACEAFVRSQTGEGWRLIKTAYDGRRVFRRQHGTPGVAAGRGTAIVYTATKKAGVNDAQFI